MVFSRVLMIEIVRDYRGVVAREFFSRVVRLGLDKTGTTGGLC